MLLALSPPQKVEDSNLKNLQPNKTLFVVNFDTLRTRERDLEDAFHRYGRLRRCGRPAGALMRARACTCVRHLHLHLRAARGTSQHPAKHAADAVARCVVRCGAQDPDQAQLRLCGV